MIADFLLLVPWISMVLGFCLVSRRALRTNHRELRDLECQTRTFREQLDDFDRFFKAVERTVKTPPVDDYPYVTADPIYDSLSADVRNAIEAAVAIPDPPPMTFTWAEVNAAYAHLDHQHEWTEEQVVNGTGAVLRKVRVCTRCLVPES